MMFFLVGHKIIAPFVEAARAGVIAVVAGEVRGLAQELQTCCLCLLSRLAVFLRPDKAGRERPWQRLALRAS
jgi:hypothetical protein